MNDKITLAIAGFDVNFVEGERVIKPSKKETDAAKAAKIEKGQVGYPADKKVTVVYPSFDGVEEVKNFFGAAYTAAEAAREGSGAELMTDLVKSRCHDASEGSVSRNEDGDLVLDDVHYVKELTEETPGKLSTTALRAQKDALLLALVDLQGLALEVEQLEGDEQSAKLESAGYGDLNQLILVINEKAKSFREKNAVLTARDEKAAAKSAAKKKVTA